MKPQAFVNSRYKIIRPLGRGGMAFVYLAQDTQMQKEVALKVMSAHLKDPASATRFRREFKASKKLDHPNIVRLHDIGRLENGSWYYTMDYLPYPDLKEKLVEEGPFKEKAVIELVRKLASAMAHYQKEGIVHRDLKPGNILVSPHGTPIIVDFGLARDDDMTALTATGAMVGTPFYMAPEMVRGERADGKADIWAIGIIIYELLTGLKPYVADDINSLMMAISFQGYKPIEETKPKLTYQWTSVLDGCLQKEKEERFQSGEELLQAIEAMVAKKAPTAKDTKRRQQMAEDTARHAKVDKAKGGNRPFFAFSLFLLIISVLANSFLSTRKPNNYSVENLKVNSRLQSATITWFSESPYPTKIKVLRPSTLGIVHGKKGEDGRHEIELSKLKEGQEYSYVIVFPGNKESLTKSFTTAKLSLKFAEIKEEKDKLRLSFWARPKPAASQLVLWGKEKIVGPLVPTDKTSLVHKVDYPNEETKSMELLLHYGPNEAKRVDLKSLLSGPIDKLCGQMSTFDPERMAFQKNGSMKNRLHSSPYLSCYEKLRQLSPLVLRSKIVPLEKRVRFIEGIRLVWDYRLCSILRNMEVPLRKPDFGSFAMSLEPYEKKAAYVATVWKGKKDEIIAIGRKTIFSGHAQAKWSATFQLPNLASFSRAEVAFSNDGLNQVGMKATVNNKLSIKVYGLPFIKMQYYPGVLAYQRIPIDLLQEGNNRLTLEIDSFFRGLTDRNVDLLAVYVNLYE